MSGSSQQPSHLNSNVPANPSQLYPYGKAKFVGILSGAVFYGIVVVLFFQCMGALFNPINHTGGGIKRLLVVHTVAMFLFVTIYTALNLDMLFISYVGNREFTGITGFPPGPLGYEYLSYHETIGIVSTIMFLLNNWLADGLLLYRCYIVYAMNLWAIALPCLIYLATFATGIVLIYNQTSQPGCTIWHSTAINIGVPYSISVALNVLITLMIAARLVLFCREIQNALNAPFRVRGLYRAVIAVLGESSALYAVTFLLFIGTWAANNPAEYFFSPILGQTQVIAPFLIILRVAKRRALKSDIISGDISSVRIAQEESSDGSGTPPGGHSATSTGMGGNSPEGLSIEGQHES